MTDHTINTNYFPISVEELANPQSFSLQQLCHALETNTTCGILGDSNDLYRRRKSFGSNNNFYSPNSSSSVTKKSFCKLTLEAFKDTTVVLLLCCVVLSLVIGIKRNGLQEALFDFAIIFLPILFVLNFSVTYRFIKARWISKKRMSRNKKKVIRVLRHQQLLQIPSSEVVVGDMVFLVSGDEVPADGVLIQGNSFKFDDGTSHLVRDEMHHVLFNRTKLVEGNCQFLVTAVGENKERIKLMKRVIKGFQNEDGHDHRHEYYSKLQKSIDEMSSFLDKLSLSLSLIILVVQVFRCFLWNKSWCCNKDRDPKGVKNTMEEIMNEATKYMRRKRDAKGNNEVNGFVAMVCILVFSLKDGLSLGIFIVLLYASIDMKKNHQIIVHKLPSCANGALVTTLCLSKTSDFVLNHTTLADLWIGFEIINDMSAVNVGAKDFTEEVLNTLREGICMNINGHVDEDALLIWAEKLLGGNIEELHGSCSILSHENCYPRKGLCGVLLKRNKEEVGEFLHVHWKGEPKLVLSMCSNYYDINNGTIQTLDEEKRELFNRKIASTIVSNRVHCFGFAYKQVIRSQDQENDTIAKDGLSFLGIVVLKNPYSSQLRRTIEVCRKSGIEIKLMVDDDLNTARLMALNSGVLRVEEDVQGSIVEAAEFRSSTKEAQIGMCHKIKVMANCSPADKLLLVHCLRKRGRHVAATGSSIRDLPSLKEADIGIFFGENCADLAKEDADVTIVDSSFGKILAILILGRYVCTNLEKFIQLQLILNISAFTSNFVLLILNPTRDQDQQLTPFQLLWVNLIMEVFGALFLAIITSAIKPHESNSEVDQITLNYSRLTTNYGMGAPIVTNNMLRNIVVHSMLQVTLLLMLTMKGKSIFRFDEASLSTMIFNIYVLCQVFLLIMSAIEMIMITKTRIFKGKIITRRQWLLFMASGIILGIIVVLQVILIQVMSKIDHWKKLGIKQWSICIGTAALTLPIHYAAKIISSAMQSFLILFNLRM